MQKQMHRLLSLMLGLILVVGLIPTVAFAAEPAKITSVALTGAPESYTVGEELGTLTSPGGVGEGIAIEGYMMAESDMSSFHYFAVTPMSPTSTFKADKYYYYVVMVNGADGYDFTDSTIYTINGKTARAEFFHADENTCMLCVVPYDKTTGQLKNYDCPIALPGGFTAIDSVDISGVPESFTPGDVIDVDLTGDSFTVSNPHAILETDRDWYVDWYKSDSDTVGFYDLRRSSIPSHTNETFSGDKYYYISIVLYADVENGYMFTENTTFTINGKTAAWSTCATAGSNAFVYAAVREDAPAVQPTKIDSITIEGLPAPQYGMGVKEYDDNVVEEKIKNGSITVNGQVGIDEDFGNIWSDGARTYHKDESIFDNVPEYYYSAKFEEDTYYLGFWFTPATGYTFADDLSATVDGVNNADVSIKDAGDDWIVVWIKYEITAPSSAPTEYNITVTGGTASANKAVAGTVITLTVDESAIPAGKVFDKWEVVSGGVTVTDGKFTMPANAVEINATYKDAPVVTEAPVISYEVTDDAVIITATGKGEVKLYADDDEPVNNPYIIPRGETEITVTFTATAKEEGKEISETVTKSVTVPAVQPTDPVDPTTKPTTGNPGGEGSATPAPTTPAGDGDNRGDGGSNLWWLWVLIAVVAIGGIVLFVILGKKKKAEE